MSQVGSRDCSTLYRKFPHHQKVQTHWHNSVILASYKRMTINIYLTVCRIRLFLSIALQRRNTSIPCHLLTIPVMMEFWFADIMPFLRQVTKFNAMFTLRNILACWRTVSSQLYFFYVVLFLHILYLIITLISDRFLAVNPHSSSSARWRTISE